MWNPFEPSALSDELQTWLETKKLSPKDAALLLGETLSQFVGFCPATKEDVDRALAEMFEKIKSAVEIASRSKKRDGSGN